MSTPYHDCCPALDASAFLGRRSEGARVLDVRSAPHWAASHVRGSIFVGFNQMFGKWVEALLDPSTPWLLIADSGVEPDAIRVLVDLGFGDLCGHLEGGYGTLAPHPEELIHTERVDHSALASELCCEAAPYLLDVRQPQEWQAGRIGSAPNLPLTEIEKRQAEVPKDRRVILQCQGGFRSLIAASILEFHGHEGIVDMSGGFGSWAQAGLPVNPAE